jgi:hypothetical protein
MILPELAVIIRLSGNLYESFLTVYKEGIRTNQLTYDIPPCSHLFCNRVGATNHDILGDIIFPINR